MWNFRRGSALPTYTGVSDMPQLLIQLIIVLVLILVGAIVLFYAIIPLLNSLGHMNFGIK